MRALEKNYFNFIVHGVKKILVLALQFGIIFLCYDLSVRLRYGFDIPPSLSNYFNYSNLTYSGLGVFFLTIFGFHKGWFRYVGLFDLGKLWLVIFLHTFLYHLLLRYVLIQRWDWVAYIPRSAFIINFFIQGFAFSVWRTSYRIIQDLKMTASGTRKPVLVIGEVNSVLGLVRLLRSSNDFTVKAILTNEKNWKGTAIDDVSIYSPIDETLPGVISKYDVKDIILQDGSVQEVRKLLEIIPSDVRVLRMPAMDSLLQRGALLGTELRPYSINDLMSRNIFTKPSEALISLIDGKKVFVTGAGGSIGSEICRQVSKMKCSELILLDHSENNLFLIYEELKNQVKVTPLLIDLRNHLEINKVLEDHRPQIILHCAAFKHVGMMELNPIAAFENNVFGLENILKKSQEIQVEFFVNISTDKAAQPSSVMGLSKAFGEHLVTSFSRQSSAFQNVRFGNVLGSNGSVVPIFQKQISSGGPVTVTDPRATRFLMTIPEACHLVLETLTFTNNIMGDVHILKMGEPVSILKLAETMIRLSGLQPYEDIPIHFIGLRKGEKLHESLLDETQEKIVHDSENFIHVRINSEVTNKIHQLIADLKSDFANQNSSPLSRSELFTSFHNLNTSGNH